MPSSETFNVHDGNITMPSKTGEDSNNSPIRERGNPEDEDQAGPKSINEPNVTGNQFNTLPTEKSFNSSLDFFDDTHSHEMVTNILTDTLLELPMQPKELNGQENGLTMDHLPTTEVLNQHVEPELTQEESFRVLEALNTIRVGGLGGTEPVIIDTSSFIGK